MLRIGKLSVAIFQHRVVILSNNCLILICQEFEQIEHAEARLQKIFGSEFRFAGHGEQTKANNSLGFLKRGQTAIWFVQATATEDLEARLMDKELVVVPYKPEPFSVWTSKPTNRQSLLAVNQDRNVLIACATEAPANGLANWVGITRATTVVAKPGAFQSGRARILHQALA